MVAANLTLYCGASLSSKGKYRKEDRPAVPLCFVLRAGGHRDQHHGQEQNGRPEKAKDIHA